MASTTSDITFTLTGQQASAIYKLMVEDFGFISRALVTALKKKSMEMGDIVIWSTKLLELQAAFDAFSGTKVFVQCRSKDISQCRLRLRKSGHPQTRVVLNNLRTLLRVSADIPALEVTETSTVTLSVGTRAVIKHALMNQWTFHVTKFTMILKSINDNMALWKSHPAENDNWLREQLTLVSTCRIGMQGMITGAPVLQVAEGELEQWLSIVDKATTDPMMRLYNIRILSEFLGDLPVYVHGPGPRTPVDTRKIQRVHRIAMQEDSKGILKWFIELTPVAQSEVADIRKA